MIPLNHLLNLRLNFTNIHTASRTIIVSGTASSQNRSCVNAALRISILFRGISVKYTRFFLFSARWSSSVTLLSCFRMSCNAFASVINENAPCDLAVALKSVRLPLSTVRRWLKMVSMIVCEMLACCRKKFSRWTG